MNQQKIEFCTIVHALKLVKPLFFYLMLHLHNFFSCTVIIPTMELTSKNKEYNILNSIIYSFLNIY